VFKLTSSGTETVLYNFQSGGFIYPYPGLVVDTHGNLYGNEPYAGENGQGIVFKITTVGDETVLYAFGGQSSDGFQPNAGFIFDKQGNLYGTTQSGGASNMGTVFKLAPSGVETVLHSFGSQSNDGVYPFDGLVLDKHGNLYGTTLQGGANGYGSVFKVSPSGTETVLYSFGSQSRDGYASHDSLVFDKQGNLYGTTYFGGANGYGTVFKVTPSGSETVLYSFGSQSGDGLFPFGSLIFDHRGNLYGTTLGGGANGGGTVFKLAQ